MSLKASKMKQLELDLEYLSKLSNLISKVRVCSKATALASPYNKTVVAGGAIRDMLFNKPVSDIDVLYEGELKEDMLKQYFSDVVTSDSVYPDGFNVTHNLLHPAFPVKIQLIQVKDIAKHIETFPSPMMRMWLDGDGIHGLDTIVYCDAKDQTFFWDQAVDLSYFLKIKHKYSDWKHVFLEKHFNPEPEEEFMEF